MLCECRRWPTFKLLKRRGQLELVRYLHEDRGLVEREKTGVTCHELCGTRFRCRDAKEVVRELSRGTFLSSAVAARFGARVAVRHQEALWSFTRNGEILRGQGIFWGTKVCLGFDVCMIKKGLTAHTLMAFGGPQTSSMAGWSPGDFRTPHINFDHPRTRQAGIYGEHIA
jgi:hypothetical protein